MHAKRERQQRVLRKGELILGSKSVNSVTRESKNGHGTVHERKTNQAEKGRIKEKTNEWSSIDAALRGIDIEEGGRVRPIQSGE